MKLYILKEEDLYAGCGCGEGDCGSHYQPTVWNIVGVYSSRIQAESIISILSVSPKRYFYIDEFELDSNYPKE